jgi:hypothetical protein
LRGLVGLALAEVHLPLVVWDPKRLEGLLAELAHTPKSVSMSIGIPLSRPVEN